jgi:hypothetical protein
VGGAGGDQAGQAGESPGYRRCGRGLSGLGLGCLGLLGDPAVDVVTLGGEGMDTGRGAPGVPGANVVEVGPAGVASEADKEGRCQAPGGVGVELWDAKGLGGEAVECRRAHSVRPLVWPRRHGGCWAARGGSSTAQRCSTSVTRVSGGARPAQLAQDRSRRQSTMLCGSDGRPLRGPPCLGLAAAPVTDRRCWLSGGPPEKPRATGGRASEHAPNRGLFSRWAEGPP